MRRRALSTAQAGTLAMAWMSMCAMAAVASPTLFAMVSAAAFRQSAKSAHSKQLKDEWKVVLSLRLACLLSMSIVADGTACTHSTHCNDYADCTRGCPATAFPTAQMVDGRNGGSRSCREESRDEHSEPREIYNATSIVGNAVGTSIGKGWCTYEGPFHSLAPVCSLPTHCRVL